MGSDKPVPCRCGGEIKSFTLWLEGSKIFAWGCETCGTYCTDRTLMSPPARPAFPECDIHPSEIEGCIAALDYIGSMELRDLDETVNHVKRLLGSFLAAVSAAAPPVAGAVEMWCPCCKATRMGSPGEICGVCMTPMNARVAGPTVPPCEGEAGR